MLHEPHVEAEQRTCRPGFRVSHVSCLMSLVYREQALVALRVAEVRTTPKE